MGAKRVDGLLIERLEGELLVVNEATQEAHALNETAAIVFELCDGERAAPPWRRRWPAARVCLRTRVSSRSPSPISSRRDWWRRTSRRRTKSRGER
jgi:hypothetical protein